MRRRETVLVTAIPHFIARCTQLLPARVSLVSTGWAGSGRRHGCASLPPAASQAVARRALGISSQASAPASTCQQPAPTPGRRSIGIRASTRMRLAAAAPQHNTARSTCPCRPVPGPGRRPVKPARHAGLRQRRPRSQADSTTQQTRLWAAHNPDRALSSMRYGAPAGLGRAGLKAAAARQPPPPAAANRPGCECSRAPQL